MAEMILLVGNPNAGKSTLFNRLTGGHAHVGNWHGVTVTALEGRMKTGERVVDLPGLYTLEGTGPEEKFAAEYLLHHENACLVFVTECENLPRSLPLMAAATASPRRCLVVLTKRKRFEKRGGHIDREELFRRLQTPVLYAEEDVKKWVSELASSAPYSVPNADMVGVFTPAREELGRFDRFVLHPVSGFFFFSALLIAAFFLTFFPGMPGEAAKGLVEHLFCDVLAPCAEAIPSPVVRSLIADGLISSLGSVLGFLPQILFLHLFLILLEESGLLSRLAYLADGTMEHFGLSGRAVFSLLMGFGCTAAAVLTTRGLEDKTMQRRAVACLAYLPCSAKLPIFLTLSASFFERPFLAVVLLYLLGAGLAVIAALIVRGKRRPFALELAPLQLPRPVFVIKSLLFQAKQFIMKVATIVLAFLLFSWLMSSFDFSFRFCAAEESMLAGICGGLSFLFAPIGMNDWRITYAALSGLVAKENVAGAIAMFYGRFPYSAESAFAFAVFLLTCSPCVSAIAATSKELGKKTALLFAAFETASALLLGYLTYFALTLGPWVLVLPIALLLPVLARTLFSHGTVHRHKSHNAQRLHRRRLGKGVAPLPHAPQGAGDPGKRQEGLGRPPAPAG